MKSLHTDTSKTKWRKQWFTICRQIWESKTENYKEFIREAVKIQDPTDVRLKESEKSARLFHNMKKDRKEEMSLGFDLTQMTREALIGLRVKRLSVEWGIEILSSDNNYPDDHKEASKRTVNNMTTLLGHIRTLEDKWREVKAFELIMNQKEIENIEKQYTVLMMRTTNDRPKKKVQIQKQDIKGFMNGRIITSKDWENMNIEHKQKTSRIKRSKYRTKLKRLWKV